MRLAVIGSGYVGLVSTACFADMGHEVICVDKDRERIARLQNNQVPIHEQYLPELLSCHLGKRISFCTSLPEAVRTSDAVFIAVGTPQAEGGEADLSYVESVASELASHVNGYKVVVEKSTVPVFTHGWIRKTLLLHGASQGAFDVASNPEFLREGTAVSDFLYPDRVVIGTDTERCTTVLREIYRPLTSGEYYRGPRLAPAPTNARIPPPLLVTSVKSAEIIKHACNAFLAMKISFINAIACICESVGADVRQVCSGIGSDTRIGPRFLNPGIGFGGSCFPKDLAAFQAVARDCGYDFRLLEEITSINLEQRQRFLRKVRNALWILRGKRLALLGLSFKGGTDDIRESPAIAVAHMLLKEGCELSVYDPAAMPAARKVLPENVRFADSPYDAAKDAAALLILTDWPEFFGLDLQRLRTTLSHPFVIDGRNVYDPQVMAAAGFLYYSIGRPDPVPQD